MASRSAGTLLTEFNATFVPPALMPGPCPRRSLLLQLPYGNTTFKYFQDHRNASMEKSYAILSGGCFPTIFSPNPSLVLSDRSQNWDRWLHLPTYTRFNLDRDRFTEFTDFYRAAQKQRKYYQDKTGLVSRVPYFILPVRERDGYPLPTDLQVCRELLARCALLEASGPPISLLQSPTQSALLTVPCPTQMIRQVVGEEGQQSALEAGESLRFWSSITIIVTATIMIISTTATITVTLIITIITTIPFTIVVVPIITITVITITTTTVIISIPFTTIVFITAATVTVIITTTTIPIATVITITIIISVAECLHLALHYVK